MHFAEELSGRYRENRPALAAMAISDPFAYYLREQ
jgi:D-sedoheptulose 7-phosphate isomerase